MKLKIILSCLSILINAINFALNFKKKATKKSAETIEFRYLSTPSQKVFIAKVTKITK